MKIMTTIECHGAEVEGLVSKMSFFSSVRQEYELSFGGMHMNKAPGLELTS